MKDLDGTFKSINWFFFFFIYNPKASIGRHALRRQKSIICEYMNAL